MRGKQTFLVAALILAVFMFMACGGGGGDEVVFDGGGGGGGGNEPGLVPAQVSQNVPGEHTDVNAAYNNSGEGVAAWVAYSQYSTGRLLYSMYNGSGWTVPVSLGETSSAPSVASNGTGFMVVWRRDNNIYSLMHNGTGWEAEAAVESTPYNGDDPVVASNGTGYAAIWRQYHQSTSTGSYAYRLFSNFHDGSAWGDPTNPIQAEGLEDDYGISSYPMSLVSNGTNYAAVWRNEDASSLSNIYATFSSGSGWDPEVRLSNSTVKSYSPVAASNGNGYAVAWHELEGVYNVYGVIYNGTDWETVETLDNSPNYSYTAAIVSNGTGYAVAWRTGGTPDVYATMHNGADGASWEAAEVVENVVASSTVLGMASDGEGYAVIWSMPEGGSQYNCYASIYSAGTWGDPSNPTLIESGAGLVSYYSGSLAWDGTGYAAFWVQDNGTAGSIFYNRHNGSAWGVEADLVTGDFYSNTKQPVAVMNSSGIAMAAWVQYEGERSFLYSRLFNGTAWETAGKISGSNTPGDPAIITNGTDFMLIASGGGSMYARRYNGTAWEDAVSLENISTPSSSSVMAAYGQKYAAVWSQYDYGLTGYNIYANVYNGTVWEDPASIAPISSIANRAWWADVASNGDSFMAVWAQYDGVEESIYSAYYNGSAWEPAVLVEDISGSASDPKIASNGSGYAAVWNISSGSYAAIYNGSGWEASTRIDSASGSAIKPVIASDGTSYAAVWKRSYGIYASLYNGSAWDAEEAINSEARPVDYPDIASVGSGYAVVWREYDSSVTAYNLYQNTYSGSWGTASIVGETATELTANPTITAGAGLYSSVWTQTSADDSFVDAVWGYMGF